MAGVEILAMEEVAVEFAFNWTAFFICFGAVFVIFVLCGIILSTKLDDWTQPLVCVIAGMLLGAFFGIVVGSALENPTKYETQYKVIISDEVPMSGFLEKYEIVDQEGKIFTVREINDGN